MSKTYTAQDLLRLDEAVRADASPEMEAFKTRNAARVVSAESGERRAQALIDQVAFLKKEVKRLEKAGKFIPIGPSTVDRAVQATKHAKAGFGLVLNELKNGYAYKFEAPIAKAEAGYQEAQAAVAGLESAVGGAR